MKTSARGILITAILAVFASSSMIAQTGNSHFDQWYRAKYGRPSPTEQTRLDTAQVNTAATRPMIAVSSNAGFEQWYRAKYGRPSPAEETRLDIAQVNSGPAEAKQPAVAVSAEQAIPAGTPTLGKSELKALIAAAKTPVEHEAIAKDYRDQGQDYLAQAKQHEAMVVAYKASPNMTSKNQAATINHCEYFVGKLNRMAAKSQELAQQHEQMAKDAEKN